MYIWCGTQFTTRSTRRNTRKWINIFSGMKDVRKKYNGISSIKIIHFTCCLLLLFCFSSMCMKISSHVSEENENKLIYKVPALLYIAPYLSVFSQSHTELAWNFEKKQTVSSNSAEWILPILTDMWNKIQTWLIFFHFFWIFCPKFEAVAPKLFSLLATFAI